MMDIKLALSLGLPIKLTAQQANGLCQQLINHEKSIAELENLINTQVFPSSGDGFSSEYIKGYEEALGDLDKILKEQGK
jgi:hypothetical protein